MVSIVLASHGDLAEGLKMTGSMVFGDQPNVATVSLMPSMGPDHPPEGGRGGRFLRRSRGRLVPRRSVGRHPLQPDQRVRRRHIQLGDPDWCEPADACRGVHRSLRRIEDGPRYRQARHFRGPRRRSRQARVSSLWRPSPRQSRRRPSIRVPSPRARSSATATSSSCSPVSIPVCSTVRWQPRGPR